MVGCLLKHLVITKRTSGVTHQQMFQGGTKVSGQRRWIKVWARTVGMPIGATDSDKPEFLPIKQSDVIKALAFRTFWIALHVVTCIMIIAGNGRTIGWW
jgi:hypothetical protein